ncbi:interleukin-20 receptor subunit alpha-like isoform X2 [Xyrauchen texanus]|uniref:interleukin-20 receptor subunit alpha-like isoform X2 n=1 Tax=Xyrauchen texanus TaxID=154827 RepID=UPI002242B075|nr:interleukin-20 receptor subunit alpha-like isoform X2 [Xyrauchen texanus]
MDTVLLIALCLLLGRTSGEGLPEPQNVHFYSLNLGTRVRWTPGDGALNGTLYTVEYAIYGDAEESNSEQVRWRQVKQCTSITQTECDVSREMYNLLEEYYARVRAISPDTQSIWTESESRFRPMFDTILGPPLVEVTLVQNYVNVTIKGPFRKTKRSKKDKSLWKIFPHMIYNVSVYNSKSKHTQYFLLKNGNLTLGPLEFSTHLCVVAQAQSQSFPLATKPSERMCAETPKDPFKDQLLTAMLGGVLPSALCLCILAVLGGFIHCYINDHRQTLPKSTDMVHASENLQTFQPERPTTINLNLIGLDGIRVEFPVALLQPDSGKCSSDGDAQALPLPAAVELPVSYAQQHVPAPNSSSVVSEDWQVERSASDDSDLQPWPQKHSHDEAGEYGIVLPATLEIEGPCGAEVNLYRTQGNMIEPRQLQDEKDEEEEAQTFLDWSPTTCELKIPLMGLLGLEDEAEIETEVVRDEVPLLPNVILRQVSEESSEQEDDFTKMEKNWGLVIHSNPE